MLHTGGRRTKAESLFPIRSFPLTDTALSCTLKMEAACSFETSVNSYTVTETSAFWCSSASYCTYLTHFFILTQISFSIRLQLNLNSVWRGNLQLRGTIESKVERNEWKLEPCSCFPLCIQKHLKYPPPTLTAKALNTHSAPAVTILLPDFRSHRNKLF
jgi:hypothetical protein